MSVNEYATTSTEKMKLVTHLVPAELSKDEIFSNGLPVDFDLMMKIAKNLKEAI